MSLQEIFYALGIAFIISWFVLIVFVLFIFFLVYRKVKGFQKHALGKAADHAGIGKFEIAGIVIGFIGRLLLNRIKRIFKK